MLAVAFASGCAAPSGSQAAPEPEAAPSVEVVTPSPTPTQAPLMSFDTTDDEGYTAHVDVGVPSVSYSSSVANASPGFADLSTPLALQAVMTNTTPGRNSEWHFQFDLYSAYPTASPVCQLGEDYTQANRTAIVTSEAHCYIQIGLFAGAGLLLGPDERSDLPAGYVLDGSDTKVAFTGTSANLPNVPEDQAQTLLDALNTPDGFAVGVAAREGSDGSLYPSVCTTTPKGNVSGIIVWTNFVAVSNTAACG